MYHFKQWELSSEPWRGMSMRLALTNGLQTLPKSALPAKVLPERIAIVTVCDYDHGVTPLASLSRINKQAYASNHQYDFIHYEQAPTYVDPLSPLLTEPASHRPPAWSKVDALLHTMAEGRYDWVMWMDCDSYFMDQEVALETVIQAAETSCSAEGSDSAALKSLVTAWQEGPPASVGKDAASLLQWYDDLSEQHLQARLKSLTREQQEACAARDSVFHPLNETLGWGPWLWEEKSLQMLASEDGLMLNTGNLLVRASPWSWRFFQKVRWMTFGRSPVTQHPWWEQTAM
eukprot:5815510-Amphidinium_carterae.1